MPLPVIARAYRFVLGDGSLTIAVAILAVFLFWLYPMAELGLVHEWTLDLAFAAFLLMGGFFVFEPRTIVKAFVALVFVTVFVRVAGELFPSRLLETLDAILVLATSIALAALLFVRVMRDGRINVHRILGACGTFLLMGLVFAQAYKLIALYVPHAFAIGGTPVDAAAMAYKFVYYSFITLTSTGYGDITPVHPYARSLATFEALSGQLYLAVLIARLVGLEMAWRETLQEQKPDP